MIRPFQMDDLAEVLQIWLEANTSAHSFLPAAYWTANAPAVRAALPRAEVYVQTDDATGRIGGFIGLDGSHIEGLFVRDGCRSRGIGKELLNEAKRRHPALTLEVYRKNVRAAAFYQREQFTVSSAGTDRGTGEEEWTMVWSRTEPAEENGGGPAVRIRRETPADYRETEALVRDAFWNVYRPGCTEHYLLHCFRTRPEFVPELDLVLERDGRIAGQIMYVRSEIVTEDGTSVPTVTFGPVSVRADCRGRGYGQKLVDRSMEAAAGLGAGAAVITGDPGFYGRSGFRPGRDTGIRYRPDPDAGYLLVRELVPGYLENVRGTFSDPSGYRAAEEHPEDFAAYDRRFPAREKKVLPGQLDRS